MLGDFACRRDQGEGGVDREQQVAAWQIYDAAKPPDEMRRRKPKLIEGKVGKTSVGLGGGMSGQEPLPCRGAGARPHLPHEGHPPAGEGIA